MVIRLGQGVDLHMAQLMPLLLIVSCSSKQRNLSTNSRFALTPISTLVRPVLVTGFTVLVPAHHGNPGQMAVKQMLLLFQMIGILWKIGSQ